MLLGSSQEFAHPTKPLNPCNVLRCCVKDHEMLYADLCTGMEHLGHLVRCAGHHTVVMALRFTGREHPDFCLRSQRQRCRIASDALAGLSHTLKLTGNEVSTVLSGITVSAIRIARGQLQHPWAAAADPDGWANGGGAAWPQDGVVRLVILTGEGDPAGAKQGDDDL